MPVNLRSPPTDVSPTVDVLPYHLRFGVTEQSFRRRIEGFDTASRIDDDDAVDGRFHHRAPARLACAQPFFEADTTL